MFSQDREECVVETLAICAFPIPGQECKVKKTGARSLKKTGARSPIKSSGVLAEVQVADEPTRP